MWNWRNLKLENCEIWSKILVKDEINQIGGWNCCSDSDVKMWNWWNWKFSRYCRFLLCCPLLKTPATGSVLGIFLPWTVVQTPGILSQILLSPSVFSAQDLPHFLSSDLHSQVPPMCWSLLHSLSQPLVQSVSASLTHQLLLQWLHVVSLLPQAAGLAHFQSDSQFLMGSLQCWWIHFILQHLVQDVRDLLFQVALSFSFKDLSVQFSAWSICCMYVYQVISSSVSIISSKTLLDLVGWTCQSTSSWCSQNIFWLITRHVTGLVVA